MSEETSPENIDAQKEIGKKKFDHFRNLGLSLNQKATDKAIESVLDAYLKLSAHDKVYHKDALKAILNELPNVFFEKFAKVIIDEMDREPLSWLAEIKPELEFFEYTKYLLVREEVIRTDPNSVAGCIMQIMVAMDREDVASEIHWAQQIDHYLSLYFLTESYRKMGSYANAIKTAHAFLSSLNEGAAKDPAFDYRELSTIKYMLLGNSMFLTYLYVMEKEYKKAALEFEKSLKTYSLEFLQSVFGQSENDREQTEFEMNVWNYSIALDQQNRVKKALNIIKEALVLAPNSSSLQVRKKYFKKRVKKLSEKETPAPYLKTKRAFDIDTFKETQLISREKILEDMIIEQIRYSHKVFGRELELYDSDAIRGRQYIIKNQAGILDLLLIEKSTNTLYVVELKRNKAGSEAYYQVKRYMDGLKLEVDQPLRGIICLHDPDTSLIELVKNDSEVELFSYHFDFKKLG